MTRQSDRETLLEIAKELDRLPSHVDILGMDWIELPLARQIRMTVQLRAIAGRMEGEATNENHQ